MKNVFAFLVSSSVFLGAGAAVAQLPPADPPQGKIDLTTQAPGPSVPREYRMHDGFYARASMGFGPIGATIDDGSAQDLEGSGTALGFDVLVGGSPAPGVAVGGALLVLGSVSTEFERSGASEDLNFSSVVLGPFIDGFPMPNKGFHLGGALGLAVLDFEGMDSQTTGFGGAAWVGYDFWVADEWSVGPLFRLGGSLTQNDDDVDASSLSAVFLFTALYH